MKENEIEITEKGLIAMQNTITLFGVPNEFKLYLEKKAKVEKLKGDNTLNENITSK